MKSSIALKPSLVQYVLFMFSAAAFVLSDRLSMTDLLSEQEKHTD